jgi:1,2-diacylglycerol 3-alpha-glucosyltransferase
MIYNLGLGFIESGHEVTLIAAEEFKPSCVENYEFEVIFQKTSFRKLFLVGVLPLQLSLISYLKRNKKKYDLIISSEMFSMSSLFASIITPQNTIIWHEVGAHPKLFKEIPSKIWYNIVVKLFFRKVLVVARSENSLRFVRKYVKNTSDIIVDHGVNLKNFICSREKEKQFIVVSQLIRRKNVGSIINKFHAFLEKYRLNEYVLLIVGQGEEKKNLQQQIENLNAMENIHLLGFKTHAELGILLSKSTAMFVDTRKDLNMVSIPEAIVCGTPVLTNSVPLLASFIESNGVGIVREEWNEDDIYDLLQKKDQLTDACIHSRDKLSVKSNAENLIRSYMNFKRYLYEKKNFDRN